MLFQTHKSTENERHIITLPLCLNKGFNDSVNVRIHPVIILACILCGLDKKYFLKLRPYSAGMHI